jgi:hypothetical protein
MRHETVKSANRRRPGPGPKGVLPWATTPSFCDPVVQRILSRRKDRLGWPIKCWLVLESLTSQRPHTRPWQAFLPVMKFKNKRARQAYWRGLWLDFSKRFYRDPDFIAPLFAAMTLFHKTPPKKWPMPRKLACLSAFCEPEGDSERSSPLRLPRVKERLEKWFGNDMSLEIISVYLSRERKRRKKIEGKWLGHIEYARAFEQIDQSLAINSNKSKLERKLWLRRQSMRRAYYASVEKIRVNPAKSGF